MLAYQWFAKTGTPVVFLHGLLGSIDDWADVIAQLQNFPKIRPLAIDLPFHNQSQQCHCTDFESARSALDSTLKAALGNQPFWLVGYSLGGRIALDYWFNQQNPNLLGLILEGANIGLQTETERQSRWQNDLMWAERFRREPLAQVLEDWYQQPVFASLTAHKRSVLIKNRQNNCGSAIAQMLQATSLAKQADFSQKNWQNMTFLIGEQDNKFRQMAETHHLPYRLVPKAGHNAHWENPTAFATQLVSTINKE